MWRFCDSKILPDLDTQCHSKIEIGGSPIRVTALSTVFTGFSANRHLSAVAHFVFLGQFLAFLCPKMSYLRTILAYFVSHTNYPAPVQAKHQPPPGHERSERARAVCAGLARVGAQPWEHQTTPPRVAFRKIPLFCGVWCGHIAHRPRQRSRAGRLRKTRILRQCAYFGSANHPHL